MNEIVQTQSNQRKAIKYNKWEFETDESFIAQLEDQIAITDEILNEMYDEYKLSKYRTYTITDNKNGKYTVKLSDPPPPPPEKDIHNEDNNNNGVMDEPTDDDIKAIWYPSKVRDEHCVTLKAGVFKCETCVGMGHPCRHVFVVARKYNIKIGVESVNSRFRLSQEGLNWIKINRESWSYMMLRINNRIEIHKDVIKIKYSDVKLNGSAEKSVEDSFEQDLLRIIQNGDQKIIPDNQDDDVTEEDVINLDDDGDPNDDVLKDDSDDEPETVGDDNENHLIYALEDVISENDNVYDPDNLEPEKVEDILKKIPKDKKLDYETQKTIARIYLKAKNDEKKNSIINNLPKKKNKNNEN